MSAPLTEADRAIVEKIVEAADQSGGLPTRNGLMRELGVGAGRATRLLAAADQLAADRSGPNRAAAPDLPPDPDMQPAGPRTASEATQPARTGNTGPDRGRAGQSDAVNEQVSAPDRPDQAPDAEVDQAAGPRGLSVARSGPVGGDKPGPARRPPSGPARVQAGLARFVRRLARSDRLSRSGMPDRSIVAVRTTGPAPAARLPVRFPGTARQSGPVQPSPSGPDRHRSEPPGPGRSWSARSAAMLITAAPLLGLNAIAMFGQFDAFSHMPNISGPGALGIGLVLETIALFLAHHAHQALVAGDSATRLRLASYVFGAAIGALNYHDQAGPDWQPTPLAVIFGLASALSPWLWSVHSRRTNRDRLLAMGLIERRAAKFAGARWIAYPIRTLRMLRWSIWTGEQEPAVAVNWWEQQHQDQAGQLR